MLTRAGHSNFAHAFRFMAIDYCIPKWNRIEKQNTVSSLSGYANMQKKRIYESMRSLKDQNTLGGLGKYMHVCTYVSAYPHET